MIPNAKVNEFERWKRKLNFSSGASVGAFVASTNVTCTRFYSRVIYNRTAQELMDGLQQCMRGERIDLQKFHHLVCSFRFTEGIPSSE